VQLTNYAVIISPVVSSYGFRNMLEIIYNFETTVFLNVVPF
jgi:hypothetical protein